MWKVVSLAAKKEGKVGSVGAEKEKKMVSLEAEKEGKGGSVGKEERERGECVERRR